MCRDERTTMVASVKMAARDVAEMQVVVEGAGEIAGLMISQLLPDHARRQQHETEETTGLGDSIGREFGEMQH